MLHVDRLVWRSCLKHRQEPQKPNAKGPFCSSFNMFQPPHLRSKDWDSWDSWQPPVHAPPAALSSPPLLGSEEKKFLSWAFRNGETKPVPARLKVESYWKILHDTERLSYYIHIHAQMSIITKICHMSYLHKTEDTSWACLFRLVTLSIRPVKRHWELQDPPRQAQLGQAERLPNPTVVASSLRILFAHQLSVLLTILSIHLKATNLWLLLRRVVHSPNTSSGKLRLMALHFWNCCMQSVRSTRNTIQRSWQMLEAYKVVRDVHLKLR